MKERSHDEAMAKQFHSDPTYAAKLLDEVRLDGDSAELTIVLRQMARAFRQDEGGDDPKCEGASK